MNGKVARGAASPEPSLWFPLSRARRLLGRFTQERAHLPVKCSVALILQIARLERVSFLRGRTSEHDGEWNREHEHEREEQDTKTVAGIGATPSGDEFGQEEKGDGDLGNQGPEMAAELAKSDETTEENRSACAHARVAKMKGNFRGDAMNEGA